jgi:CRP/FNR family cyclic AMP-dependent transcriptional regulator
MRASEALRTMSFLARASDQALDDLAARSTWRRFRRGEHLFLAGAPTTRVYVIVEGHVAAVSSSAHGDDLIVHVATTGEGAGFVELLEAGPHSLSARALGPVHALAVPAAGCLDLLRAEPAVMEDFARSLSAIARALNGSLADLVFLDLERRLARTLVALGGDEDLVTIDTTQTELAARLGVARQSLHQAFGKLVRRGLLSIDSTRSVRILDRSALESFIASPPRAGP